MDYSENKITSSELIIRSGLDCSLGESMIDFDEINMADVTYEGAVNRINLLMTYLHILEQFHISENDQSYHSFILSELDVINELMRGLKIIKAIYHVS